MHATRTIDGAPDGGATAGSEPVAMLSADGAAKVASELGLAAFEWDIRRDQFRWSANAADVLGIEPGDLPTSSRALQRLMTPTTHSARAAAVPPFDHAAKTDGHGPDYLTRWSLSGPNGERWMEETGRWSPVEGTDGFAVRGNVRAIAAVASEPAGADDKAVGGILKRELLLDRLSSVLAGLNRDREGSAAFVVFAIDGLGSVNSAFGYDVGDEVIATIARRIAGRMRQKDILGHMSGHKFGAILHDCTESMLAFAVERFVNAVSEDPIGAGDTSVAASVSIGAVVVPRNATDAGTAAIRAEEALDDARAGGGNRAVVYAPSAERDRRRQANRQTAEDVARGIAESRFLLAYQPIVDASSGAVIHHEALSRLLRRDGTIVSAGALIATAERLGLVDRIDLRSLSLALADLSAHPELTLSINVSVPTALGGQWMQRLVEAVSGDRSLASRLTVEITETAAATDAEGLRQVAETLRDVGCRLAVDDFGVGHTSLRALRDLEVDWVKIDGSFVVDLASNPDSRAFVRALVALAEHLGIKTVAEWVEDEAVATILRDLGVAALQGFHIGRPLLRLAPDATATLSPWLDAAKIPSADVFLIAGEDSAVAAA